MFYRTLEGNPYFLGYVPLSPITFLLHPMVFAVPTFRRVKSLTIWTPSWEGQLSIWKWHVKITEKTTSSSDPHQVTFFDICSDILFGIHILSQIFSYLLSGILFGISSEILCGWGPAGNTLIRSSRLRSGWEHFDPELAVEARRGTLWSWACGWGPVGNTLIRSSRLRSGKNTLIRSSRLRPGWEHFDPELAVEARRGTLWSWACGWGPVRKHSDPELAVEARLGTLWSWACSGGPAEAEEAEKKEAAGQLI